MARAGGLTAKLHAVTDGGGRPLRFLPSAGQVGDHAGALALPDTLPRADRLVADQGHDADWFREALADKAIRPCLPGRRSRDRPIKHDKRRCWRRHRIGNDVRPAQGPAPRGSPL
jgi:transposase